MNNSETPGYLTPIFSSLPEDAKLEEDLRLWIAGVSGLAETQVFSRWQSAQQEPPTTETDVCRFGIIGFQADANPAFMNQTAESCQLWRHEVLACLIRFYGPCGQQHVLQFRDGLCVPQNNDTLNAQGLSMVNYSTILSLPERIDNPCLPRYDITVHLSRKVTREYAVKSLVEAPVNYFGD